MFSLREFIMKGLRNAVGKMLDYQVILNAMGWFEKGVLMQEDLAELQTMIDEKNTPKEVPQIEETEEGINESDMTEIE